LAVPTTGYAFVLLAFAAAAAAALNIGMHTCENSEVNCCNDKPPFALTHSLTHSREITEKEFHVNLHFIPFAVCECLLNG